MIIGDILEGKATDDLAHHKTLSYKTENLIEETLYVRYTDLKVVLEEAFVDDVIVFDIGTLSEIEKNILK